MRTRRAWLLAVCFLFVLAATSAAQTNALRVGAAKVPVNPPDNFFQPDGERTFVGVHDAIFARAIVIDDGSGMIAMIGLDMIGLPQDLDKAIASELGIAPERVMITATHDHNSPGARGGPPQGAPSAGAGRAGGAQPPAAAPGRGQASNPAAAEYAELIRKGTLDAVRKAKAALQPARVGFGTGKAYVNVNRDQFLDGRWMLGTNVDRPSDKTVGVIKFESLSGEPIAIYINYAVHGVVMYTAVTKGKGWEITGDLPGYTSRYVEEHYKNVPVALWTSGAAGDQNPVYMALYNQALPGRVDEGAAGYVLVDVQSRRLGEEAVRVADSIKAGPLTGRVRGSQKIATCPGQRISRDATSGQFTVTQTPPVDIRLSVLMIGDIALGGVSGEVVTVIGQHFKQASPLPNTLMVTHAGGSIGYIPDDASYPLRTFEVTGSRLKEGCSENAIVNGLLELMKANANR